MEHFFSPNSGKDQKKKKKKRSSPKEKHFFPRIQVDTYAQMHTRVKLLGRMQMYTTPQTTREIQPNYWGDISSPGFGTPVGNERLLVAYC